MGGHARLLHAPSKTHSSARRASTRFLQRFKLECLRGGKLQDARSVLLACLLVAAIIIIGLNAPVDRPVPISQTSRSGLIAFIVARSNVDDLVSNLGPQWFVDVSQNADVFFLVGDAIHEGLTFYPNISNAFLFNMHCADKAYPPLNKTATFYARLHELFPAGLLPYDWVLVVDSDTYVRPDALARISFGRDPTDAHYLGRPLHHCACNEGYKTGDKCELELGVNYCSGMGYLVSRGALDRMRRHWLALTASFIDDGVVNRCHSSDTFVGWAMQQQGIFCERAVPLDSATAIEPPSGVSWGAPDARGIKTKQQTAFCQNSHHQGGLVDVGNVGKTYMFRGIDFQQCLLMHPLKNEAQFRYVQFAASTNASAPDTFSTSDLEPPSTPDRCLVAIGVFAVRNKPVPRDAIRATWKRLAEELPGVRVYFLIARSGEPLPEHEELALRREALAHKDVVELDMVDAYDALYTKSLKFLEWGTAQTNCSYFFKTDDDSYLRALPLVNFIGQLDRNDTSTSRKYFGKQWGTHGGKLSPVIKDPQSPWYGFDHYPHDFYPPYMSGSGYGISRDLATDVVRTSKSHPAYRCEDAGIGILVNEIGNTHAVKFYTNPDYFGAECSSDSVLDNPAFHDDFNMYHLFNVDMAGGFCPPSKIKTVFLGGRSKADALVYAHPAKYLEPPEEPWSDSKPRHGAQPIEWKYIQRMSRVFDEHTNESLSTTNKDFVLQAVKAIDRRVQATLAECYGTASYKDVFVSPEYVWSMADVAVMYRCAMNGRPRLALAVATFAAENLAWPIRIGLTKESGELAMVLTFSGRADRLGNFFNGTAARFAEYGTRMNKRIVISCGLLDGMASDLQCANDPDLLEIVEQFEHRHGNTVRVSIVNAGMFSRSATLNAGLNSLANSTVAIAIDADCDVHREFFDKVVAFVQQGKSVYFPIVFSRYSNESIAMSRHKHVLDSMSNHFVIHPDTGSWRRYGFGMVAAAVSDFRAIGMFNEEFKVWGNEDYDIWMRFVRSSYQLWRVYDPSIVHTYHKKHCEFAAGDADKYKMCLASKYSNEGTPSQIGMRIETAYTNQSVFV